MDGILEAFDTVVQYFLGLGNAVFVPIVLFLLAVLWFRMKLAEAFRASVMIAVGFVGINMIVGFLINTLSPAVQAMVERFNLAFNVVDTGSISAITIGFAAPTAVYYIPVGIAVNLIMLALKWTKTINIDIWNFWGMAFTGGLIYALTGSVTYGVIAVAITAVVNLLIADWTQPISEKFFGLPGITITTGVVTAFGLVAWPFIKLVEMIPGLKDWDVTPESIQARLGPLGESPVMGLILGIGIGVLGGATIPEILTLGVSMAGVFVLLMRIVAVLMEGLVPIAEQAKTFLTERYKGREIYIGLDAALTIGHPAVLATSLLMMPIAFLLAAILPGNTFLPSADLIIWPFVFATIVGLSNGNIVKSVIASCFALGIGFYFSSFIAPGFTEGAAIAGLPAMVEGQMASNVVPGSTLPTFLTYVLFNFLK
jgi:PTS system galactitol-specific IIC component